jgi:cytosine permease
MDTTTTTGTKARSNLARAAEDHSLASVPAAERKSGWSLALSPISVATALVIFAIGGFTVMLAGFSIGLLAGVVVAIIAVFLGKALGTIAFRTGVSSTVTSRLFGFGQKGSVIGSAIFAFMILGFLAMESALLYEGTLVMFNLQDDWTSRIVIYGLLTLAWIALAIFGLKIALRTSGIMTVITLLVTFYLIYQIYVVQGMNPMDFFTYAGTVPGDGWAKFQAAFGVMGATAGTIALVTMDFARYARSNKDVTILAAAGPFVQNIVMVVLGGLVTVGAVPQVVDYLMARDSGLSAADAAAAAGGFVMGNTGAFFVIFAGWVGFITIYAAQAKAQAINAYSGSLSLVNIVDALTGKRPGRPVMVVVGNVIALIMIAAGILGQFAAYLAYLGTMTLSMCAVMIVDYFIVRKGRYVPSEHRVENWNWAGILTLVLSAATGIVLMATGVFSLGFMVSFVIALVLYPLLRRLLPEGTATTFAAATDVFDEAQ